jgi:hypothetical protein
MVSLACECETSVPTATILGSETAWLSKAPNEAIAVIREQKDATRRVSV